MNNLDIFHLKLALNQAKKGQGHCAPNPCVGAVIADPITVLAQGYHTGPGHPHAEIEALKSLEHPVGNDATLYVTLEPCCHHGRTPPCTDAIIRSGIHRVVFSELDPNPKVAGKGQATLEAAGIDVHHLPIPAIAEFYQAYRHWWTTGRPWVIAKLAVSADHKSAGPDGNPVQITGLGCQQLTHQQRLHADAILTTANTVLADDPQLNVRQAGAPPIGKRVFILDKYNKISGKERVFQVSEEVVLLRKETEWPEILKTIGQHGVHRLWVEAGGTCFTRLIQAGYANLALVYVSKNKLGDDALPAFPQEFDFEKTTPHISWYTLGPDRVYELQYE